MEVNKRSITGRRRSYVDVEGEPGKREMSPKLRKCVRA